MDVTQPNETKAIWLDCHGAVISHVRPWRGFYPDYIKCHLPADDSELFNIPDGNDEPLVMVTFGDRYDDKAKGVRLEGRLTIFLPVSDADRLARSLFHMARDASDPQI
jgi:hypothetical protein